ncbi:EAL domain-containing protein [Motiliproteus coralliicola]|uniref:EAL domain-containing protein n=1 Tax=Motiliproteus coralliicola TaxID=2283196 RepID=A0A369WLE6_9GAMM|nr:EAL domain-containing protein [Motiliproteus coralliicola]RDE22457.1 EAL domain-containing protein [Motiliproteus coralliicola]
MYKNLTLNDIMTAPVITIEQTHFVDDGIAIMREKRISSLVVIDQQVPIDKLKIDQSFVRDLPYDNHSNAIAQAIVALGKSLELTVIAEGVETPAQAEFLSSIGCEQAQGFLYARPCPAEDLVPAFSKALN